MSKSRYAALAPVSIVPAARQTALLVNVVPLHPPATANVTPASKGQGGRSKGPPLLDPMPGERVAGSGDRSMATIELTSAQPQVEAIALAGISGVDTTSIAKALSTHNAVLSRIGQTVPADLRPSGTDAATWREKPQAIFTSTNLPSGRADRDPALGTSAVPWPVLGPPISIGPPACKPRFGMELWTVSASHCRCGNRISNHSTSAPPEHHQCVHGQTGGPTR